MQEIKQNPMNKNDEAPKGAYKRKSDCKNVEHEKDNRNLRINLLLIREMLRVMCDNSNISINQIYDYFGITSDQLSLFLTTGHGVKDDVLNNLSFILMQAGISKKFLRKTRPISIKIPEIKEEIDTYLDENCSKADKSEASTKIRMVLREFWINGNSEIKNMVFGCYRIINEIAPNKQTALFVANEALAKFLKYDFSETDIQTNDFAEFIKTLALSVEKTETLTDNPIHHNIQNSMQTISILLSYITKQDISKADAQSETCLNMISEMAKTMLLIQEILLETSTP